MLKMRVALLGVLALLIIGGATASMASALVPSWKVNGTKLGAQVKRQIKLIAGENKLKGKFASMVGTITCATAKVDNGFIEGGGAGAGQGGGTSITFNTCATTLPNCEPDWPIVTRQVKAHLITYGGGQPKIGEIFEPSQGPELVGLKFKNLEGGECNKVFTSNTFPLKGSFVGELELIGQEQRQQPLESVIGVLTLPFQPITKVKLEGQEVLAGLFIGAEGGAALNDEFNVQLGAVNQKLEPFGVFFG